MNDKMRRYAFMGFLGAMFFVAGDWLIFVYPGRNPELNVDKVYALMPVWRFQTSTVLGWLGMGGILFGFYSLYCLVKELCGIWIQRATLLSLGGVLGISLAHFNLGILQFYVYKSVLEVEGNSAIAAAAASMAGSWTTVLDGIIIALFYIQLIVLIYLIMSGKVRISRKYILMSPFGAIILGLLWTAVFAGYTIAGGWGACESLGEGLMYLAVYICWKKKNDREKVRVL